MAPPITNYPGIAHTCPKCAATPGRPCVRRTSTGKESLRATPHSVRARLKRPPKKAGPPA